MSIAELRRSHNRRHEIAGEIVSHLSTFEGDLARALASGSRLVGFLPEARSEADVSAVVGHDAISHFVTSIGLISQAMGSAVDGHNSLEQARRHFRVDVTSGGDKDQIPPLREMGSPAQPATTADAGG